MPEEIRIIEDTRCQECRRIIPAMQPAWRLADGRRICPICARKLRRPQ